ncbi:MAG: hypothetical protein ACE5HU_00110 [Acidobacteriota bacterium]
MRPFLVQVMMLLAVSASAPAGGRGAGGALPAPDALPLIPSRRAIKGAEAPDFWAYDLDGTPVRFSEARAGRIAVLEFGSYS